MGPHYLAGNGAHFSVVLKLENVAEPMNEATQMTTAQAVGAASHTRLEDCIHCRVSWPQARIE
jgi:hypothetical protein